MSTPTPTPRWNVALPDVLEQLGRWQTAVTLSHGRVMDPLTGPASRVAEMYLFATAARQVVRFSELARSNAPREARRAISAALTRFAATSPGLVEARDVIEHYDAYLRGAGNNRAGSRESYQNRWAIPNAPSFMWTEEPPGTFVLRVSPVPGEVVSVDAVRDYAATVALSDAVIEATRNS